MVETLTLEQLKVAQALLKAGKTSDFYTLMLGYGYTYAGWAQGVADADTIAGLAALDYLNDSAMPEGLPAETIENIKAGMAQAYLDTLIVIAQEEGGLLPSKNAYNKPKISPPSANA